VSPEDECREFSAKTYDIRPEQESIACLGASSASDIAFDETIVKVSRLLFFCNLLALLVENADEK